MDKSCESPLNTRSASGTQSTQSASGTLGDEKVLDHDHLTGKYRGAAHIICNINVKQMSSKYVPLFFHIFSG